MRWNGQCTGQGYTNGIAHGYDTQRVLLPVRILNLLGHPIERIDVGATAQETLPEDDRKYNPNTGRERVDDLKEKVHHIHELEHSHQPDLVKLNEIDRGTGYEYA